MSICFGVPRTRAVGKSSKRIPGPRTIVQEGKLPYFERFALPFWCPSGTGSDWRFPQWYTDSKKINLQEFYTVHTC